MFSFFFLKKKIKEDPYPSGFGIYSGLLFSSLFIGSLCLTDFVQKITQTETRNEYQGRLLLILEDGADYKIIHSLDKKNKASEFFLTLERRGFREKYYKIFRGTIRDQKRNYFETAQSLPTFFKARFERFFENGDDGELVETQAYILYEIKPF